MVLEAHEHPDGLGDDHFVEFVRVLGDPRPEIRIPKVNQSANLQNRESMSELAAILFAQGRRARTSAGALVDGSVHPRMVSGAHPCRERHGFGSVSRGQQKRKEI
jgi:hypothetical protein